MNVGKYYRFQSLELLEANTSHFDISRPIEFKPPGKYFNLEDKEVDKSSLLIEDNENINVVVDELLTNMNIHYHNLQLNIDYGSKKVKANTLNWYQQAAIAIHLIIQSNTSFDLNALYRVCIHHFIEQLTMEQHRMLLHYLDKNEDKDIEVVGILREYYNQRIFMHNDSSYIILYNEKTHTHLLLVKEVDWKVYEDVIGDIVIERANELVVMKGDYGSISGYLYYHSSKHLKYMLKLVKKGEISKKSIGFWCKDKGEAERQGYLQPLLKLGNLETIQDKKKQLQNVDTCVLFEVVLRLYQDIKLLESGLEKQWFFDPVLLYLQTKSTIK